MRGLSPVVESSETWDRTCAPEVAGGFLATAPPEKTLICDSSDAVAQYLGLFIITFLLVSTLSNPL